MFIINKVVIFGRLTRDLELSFLPGSGTAVAKGVVAVDRKPGKDGKKEADFIPVVIWGKQAESTANYNGTKGQQIGIAGRIQTRSYDAKDGTKKYVTEVVAEDIQFCGGKSSNSSSSDNTFDNQSFKDYGNEITPVDDGDIPF